jgi:hypothetical protein
MAYVESGIYVLGLNEMVAGIKAMGDEGTAELQALNLKVGNLVVREAKQLVPVMSGALQSSIRASKSLRGVVVYAGRDPNIPYANAQNWGWFYDRKNFIYKNIKPTQFMNKGAFKVRKMVADFYIEDLIKIYEKYSKTTGTLSPSDYRNSSINQTLNRR